VVSKTLDKKSIWITGANGFIGRNLALFHADIGCNVFGLGRGIWLPNEALKTGVVKWVDGSISSENLDLLATSSGPPDKIYHLAGGSSVGLSLEKPHDDFFSTVAGTANLLDWMRLNAPLSKLIAVSSAAVYGNSYLNPISEGALCDPCSPYGYHKHMMEEICQSYAKTFGINVVIARLFSVYGKFLQKQLLWELCTKLTSELTTITLGGSGNEMRDWMDVRDVVTALNLLGDLASCDAAIINVGTGKGVSVKKVSDLLLDSWPANVKIYFNHKTRSGDPFSLIGDCKRLNSLGFSPQFPVETGVADYVEWYKKFRNVT